MKYVKLYTVCIYTIYSIHVYIFYFQRTYPSINWCDKYVQNWFELVVKSTLNRFSDIFKRCA